jgi:putative N6-adenine-specific DNA methylase
LPRDGKIDVFVGLHKSTITSARSCQGVVKRGIIDRLRRRYPGEERFPENGAVFSISCLIDGPEAVVALDSSGTGLHKRGYRISGGEAPLRETTAAALPMLCKWFGRTPLWDPFCGSGTIVIEAALLAAGMPPGAKRRFSHEAWDFLDLDACRAVRSALPPAPASLPAGCEAVGSDIDPTMVELARENARRAGVDHLVRFYKADALVHEPRPGPGLVLTNPPWGERLGDETEAEAILTAFGKTSSRFAGWECAVLTSHGALEKAFGRRFTANRKLYNGNIQCRLYRFDAPR